MSGFLDGLLSGKFTDDPEKNAALQQGLLQFGLSLMSNPNKLGQALGQSGLQAIQGVSQYKNQQFQNALNKYRLTDLQRAQRMNQQQDKLAELPGQFIKPGQMGVDATGGMETAATNPNNVTAPQLDLKGLMSAYMNCPGRVRVAWACSRSADADEG